MSRSRYFSFRLRTLLLLVFLASVPLAWAAHSLNWIRERHKAFAAKSARGVPFLITPDMLKFNCSPYLPCKAPGGLHIFGETGQSVILWASRELGCPSREEVERLFPEAEIEKIDTRARQN